MKKLILAIMVIILIILICIAIGSSKKTASKTNNLQQGIRQITPQVNSNSDIDSSETKKEDDSDVQESSSVRVTDTGVNSSYLAIIGVVIMSTGIYFIRRNA